MAAGARAAAVLLLARAVLEVASELMVLVLSFCDRRACVRESVCCVCEED
jgi:hypothetical protein